MDSRSEQPVTRLKYEHRRGIAARQRILAAIERRTAPPTLSELATDLGASYATIRTHCRMLAWQGKIEFSTPRRNQPTRVRIRPCKR